MFSGKTTELFRLANRFILGNERVIMFKYAKDTRYVKRKALASSHDEHTFRAVPIASFEKNHEAILMGESADVICIDEGQFIDALVPFVCAMADQGKQVYVSGLYSTFERKPFERIANLMAHVDQPVIYLSAICVLCHKEAYFTRRLGDNKELELIGGEETYVPCCRACWNKPVEDEVLERRKKNVTRMKEMKRSI